MGRFLRYFERVLERNGQFLVGEHATYVDLAMFQVMRGLDYAFPAKFGRLCSAVPRLVELRDRVAARPRLAAYLASPRRIPFNESGIFRHYPELEDTAS
jgi:glutathione S-transferase